MGKIKEAAMATSAIAKTETVNAPAIQYDNPWLEAAAEAGSDLGQLLKFVKGKYMMGEEEIPLGTEYIAHIDQLARGWVNFREDDTVDVRGITKIADGKPPARKTLGDLDKKKWKEKDEEGNPKDPWQLQWYLPLVSDDLGEIFTFVTGTDGGDKAIGNLCGIFGHRDRNGLLPIIALKSRSYRHKKYGPVHKPEFIVVGWHGDGPKPVNQITPKTGNATANADMNDEVPF